MKAQELEKYRIYTDVLDKKTPLMFLSKKETSHCGESYFECKFKPVKTTRNKNWYNSTKIVIKYICADFGTDYIL